MDGNRRIAASSMIFLRSRRKRLCAPTKMAAHCAALMAAKGVA